VWDAEKAALEVEDYRAAISWASQTALREIIGQMTLADILVGRAKMDADLQKIIDERTTPWGITVQSVEIRDVIIPQDLEDTMSRQAQAERERQARVILGESEKQIAHSFAEASQSYIHNPTALHLRAMNMLFEGLKEKAQQGDVEAIHTCGIILRTGANNADDMAKAIRLIALAAYMEHLPSMIYIGQAYRMFTEGNCGAQEKASYSCIISIASDHCSPEYCERKTRWSNPTSL